MQQAVTVIEDEAEIRAVVRNAMRVLGLDNLDLRPSDEVLAYHVCEEVIRRAHDLLPSEALLKFERFGITRDVLEDEVDRLDITRRILSDLDAAGNLQTLPSVRSLVDMVFDEIHLAIDD